MKKLLEYMLTGNFVFVSDFSGWGDESDVPGFSWGEGGIEENRLVAPNGESLMFQSTSLRRGNHLKVSLRSNGKEIEKIYLGDIFQEQEVVIATSGESLAFFAPVCKNKLELAEFLTTIGKFCKINRGKVHFGFEANAYKLALWLYKNNPNREVEADWGI